MARKHKRRAPMKPAVKVGVAPGTPVYVGEPREERIRIHLMDYGPADVREDHEPSLDHLLGCRTAGRVSWLDLDGIHDPTVVQRVAELFELHPLWVEDVLNPTSRPKVEWLGDRLFVILRVVTLDGEELSIEQVAMVLGPSWVLSFQELPGDVWEPTRERLRKGIGRIRARGPDFLAHALMDAVVDAYFAVFRELDARVDAIEAEALGSSARDLVERVAEIKAEVDVLRGAVWPLREAVPTILRDDGEILDARTLPFFRDLADHVANLVEHLEGARDRLRGAVDLHLAVQGRQLNEVMRVLTVVSTIFMPLTFVAGIYGMNFDDMPELHWVIGYPLVLAGMAAIGVGMFLAFKRRGWL